MKKVCVVGLGYIGLPTAIVAAEAGLQVVGIDVDKKRVDCVNKCCPVIEEPEIVEKMHNVLSKKTFRATLVYEQADYFIIAVPTPFTQDKKADLSFVFSAATSIAGVLKKGDTVILESTVPVGTTKSLSNFLAEKTGLEFGIDFFVAHCPERVLPGNIFHELKVNDRVIGGLDRGSTRHVATFYKYFVSGDLYLTNAETAEMIKLVENSYRDVNIAISHQVASMAYSIGIDPYEVIELANKHPRVNLLKPTCGVGGHCLAVDPWFLAESFPEHTRLLKTAREVNENKPKEVLATILKIAQKWKSTHQKSCNILVLGATYKADVDDLRESPAFFIAQELLKNSDVNVMICEPHVTKDRLGKTLSSRAVSLLDGVDKADVIVCLVAHSQFKVLDKKVLAHKKVLDFCGLFHINRQQSPEQEQFYWPAKGYKADKNSNAAQYNVPSSAEKEREE
ncbi:MAG: UDP-N-acetyl-D-mannosaminuronic acid dehydrogenase [Alteromonas naphthalenivorans]|jgi:UDP-N-acetyl-D-mannosaminuronic acid dehydrogenase